MALPDCIEVTGRRDSRGYGRTAFGPAGSWGSIAAHRLALEQAWGITLRPEQVARHVCDNPPCVNPLHLQLGTQADNVRDMLERGRHRCATKTHCPRGHELVGGNVVWQGPDRRWRECRQCRNQRKREYRAAATAERRSA
jgi:hypothetical protein